MAEEPKCLVRRGRAWRLGRPCVVGPDLAWLALPVAPMTREAVRAAASLPASATSMVILEVLSGSAAFTAAPAYKMTSLDTPLRLPSRSLDTGVGI
jgi:hypothetical protein